MNRKLNRSMSVAISMMACVFLNGCAVMAVRTGVRAVKNIEENAETKNTGSPSENSGQEKKVGLIHRPGLIRSERIQGPSASPTNRSGAAQNTTNRTSQTELK